MADYLQTEWNDDVLDVLESWRIEWRFGHCTPLKEKTKTKYIGIHRDSKSLVSIDDTICAEVVNAATFLMEAAKIYGKEYRKMEELKFGDKCLVSDVEGAWEEDFAVFVCYTPNGVLVDHAGKSADVVEQEKNHRGVDLSFYKYVKPYEDIKEMTVAEIEKELGYSIKIVKE